MSDDSVEAAAAPARPGKRRSGLYRATAAWTRWLHIYLSMIGFAAVLFFSVTGFTLNHPNWFFRESTSQLEGGLPPSLLNNGQSPPADWDEQDFGFAVSKLEVAERLRAEHHLRGAVTDFLCFEDECEVTFAGPGYAATARIERASGTYTLLVTTNDLVSVLNDLHKGRHSGDAWSLAIDVSAVVASLLSVTGFALIFFLKLHRSPGLVVALAGTALLGVFLYIATR